MADQLNMNNLSLGESQHAPRRSGGGEFDPSAYESVHARGSTRSPALGPALIAIALCATHRRFSDGAPSMNGHFDGPRLGEGGWGGALTFTPRGGNGFDRNVYGNFVQGGGGQWRDGKHIPGPSNPRIERELLGVPNDSNVQHSSINSEKPAWRGSSTTVSLIRSWVRQLRGTERLSHEQRNSMTPTAYCTKVLLQSIQASKPDRHVSRQPPTV
ncbi:hypothetical protein E4T38_06552 [Aureobasidium subglaciale]|nr:hypothetical protein E4T38_06552 [Aureobasidium subglaciale]KAI5218950.1 hypothetical protein E4T40_06671 [Aureobasidium subglaciale]KAI5222679.1 hypothetical protein E4T41_06492 [Aureobasidium subglaciale]KAI5260202.1 hypothetical protein E4T46_06204 [Aureobasidium subglaciale]